jgi:hypothetical protein
MLHFIEADLGTLDGRHIAAGSVRVNHGRKVGKSHYCGSESDAAVLSSSPPGSPVLVSHKKHGEGIQVESELATRVNASVPPTLPGAPCGPLGRNSLIPVNFNRFRLTLYADGEGTGEFVDASLFPSHFLYKDGSIELHDGSPVHPRIDFEAWASSSVPLPLAIIGFKALRFACCHPLIFAASCATACSSGISVPKSLSTLLGCVAIAVDLAVSSCPIACAAAGAACTPPVGPSNPGGGGSTSGGPGGARSGPGFGGFGGGSGGGGGAGGES